jgi:hypothetical protein
VADNEWRHGTLRYVKTLREKPTEILIGGPEPPPDDFISKTIDGVNTRVVLPRDWEVENEGG